MLANTKQIRAIVNAVRDERGATVYETWSDAPHGKERDTTDKRYVTYSMSKVNEIRGFAQSEADRLGYSNQFRVSKNGYLRVTSFLE